MGVAGDDSSDGGMSDVCGKDGRFLPVCVMGG